MSGYPAIPQEEIEQLLLAHRASEFWLRADGRSREGRAQRLALENGWIEPVAPGYGYRVTLRGRRIAQSSDSP